MASPASKPMPTLTVLSARTTGLPSPSAPTSAAITTIDSDSMMHWVMPAMIVGSAWGSSTFHSSWRLRGAEGLAGLDAAASAPRRCRDG